MKSIEELGISPAPWVVFDESSVRSGHHWVAANAFHAEEDLANARLIAAAPELYQSVLDLLEICGNIEEYIGVDPATGGKIEAARKALAKAGGAE